MNGAAPRPAGRLSPAEFLRSAKPGTRLVARYRVPGGFTDALGYLRACDELSCQVDTRRGVVTVILANVVAAKQVPAPPARRNARHPTDRSPADESRPGDQH